MKTHVGQLYALSRKHRRMILGLMSGTSLDGLDLALCAVSRSGTRTRVELLHFDTVAYDAAFKAEIRKVFAKKEIDFQHLALLHVLIAERHAAIVLDRLKVWQVDPDSVDLLASHGQTVFHAPKILHGLPDYPNATLQIGDGDHLARRTGIITVSDFRQKHVAAGGEGAPLALYGDYYLFSKTGRRRYLLNIGGIGNFSFLPENGDPARAFATDTGPGNTLIDAYARQLFQVPYDDQGLLAAAGRVEEQLLETLLEHPFFGRPFPKTTGPEMFSMQWVQSALDRRPKGSVNPYDLIATLTRLTAHSIAAAIRRQEAALSPGLRKPQLIASGGGVHNPMLMSHLRVLLPDFEFMGTDAVGIPGDAKEAVLFAVLANETVAGNVIERAELGGIPLVGMGKISFPG